MYPRVLRMAAWLRNDNTWKGVKAWVLEDFFKMKLEFFTCLVSCRRLRVTQETWPLVNSPYQTCCHIICSHVILSSMVEVLQAEVLTPTTQESYFWPIELIHSLQIHDWWRSPTWCKSVLQLWYFLVSICFSVAQRKSQFQKPGCANNVKIRPWKTGVLLRKQL